MEFEDSSDDESQTLIEVIPSKWLFDNNTKCKYPPKKEKLKITRLVMSKMDPGKDWNIYKLQFHHYYSKFVTLEDVLCIMEDVLHLNIRVFPLSANVLISFH